MNQHRHFWSKRISMGEFSLHRMMLYGFAALWILFLHIDIPLPQDTIWLPLHWLKQNGACGVELFVLLSGMGLYRSMSTCPSVKRFYGRRLARVALPGFIVAAVFFGMDSGGFRTYLLSISLFSYWIGVQTLWYVPFILTMYLIYPALYAVQKRWKPAIWILFFLSPALSFVAGQLLPGWMAVCANGIDRIPIFLLGCAISPAIDKNAGLPRWIAPVLLAGYVLLARCNAAMSWSLQSLWVLSMSYLFLAPLILILLTALGRGLLRFAAGRGAYRLLAFAGGVSLEIYLLYSRIYGKLGTLEVYQTGAASHSKRIFAAIVLTFIAASALKALCELICKQFQSIQLPLGPAESRDSSAH